MPGSHQLVDGLWRCLCPSIDLISISRLGQPVTQVLRRPQRPPSISSHRPKAPRKLHNEASSLYPRKLHHQNEGGSVIRRILQLRQPLKETQPVYKSIDDAPAWYLRNDLAKLVTRDGKYQAIVNLVNYLVRDRGEQPSLVHYNALICANADAEQGSAEAVRTLFYELKAKGIVPNGELYHSILQALAVHPDYVLRAEVLSEMRDRWIPLTDADVVYLILGLLRDRQYEVAYDRLEQLEREGKTAPSWVYDIFTFILCEAEEFDQAIKLLKHRESHGEIAISSNLWYFVLDTCSSNYHYEGTLYTWQKTVEPDYINPPDGICLNVLNTASRHGDSALATDAIRVLSSRGVKLDHPHYESLLTSYITSGDVKSALLVLCIMKRSGLEPTPATTRPLYTHFRHYPNDIPAAVQMLNFLKQRDDHDIPTAAMNVLLEAYIENNNLPEATQLYKQHLHLVCAAGPNTDTFNLFLRGYARQGISSPTSPANIKLQGDALFMASEMAALQIRPNKSTYDYLIQVCAHESAPEFDDAFRYLEEMLQTFPKGEENRPRVRTWYALLVRCAREVDERYFEVLGKMREVGLEREARELCVREEVRWLGEGEGDRVKEVLGGGE